MGLNKSRPVYEKLALDPRGRAHLIVTDRPVLSEEMIAADLTRTDIESWVVMPGVAASGNPIFRSVADLRSHLAYVLMRAPIGLRLYAIGTEAFVWDVNNIACEAGLGRDEIFLGHAGSLCRRVYCTHCKTINEDAATNIVICHACGASLFVRDHFSRRLAAFMGVMVDAETPGEIPEIETIYP